MIDNRVLYKSQAGYDAVMRSYDDALKRWPVAVESQYVDTRHGKTHVLVAGRVDAPPLFFFHGWGGSAVGTFQELDLVRLSQHFRVYSPDTIGQSGRSAPYRPPTTGSVYGEWIVDLFDNLNIERAYVCGISGGGYLTLKIAAFAPERVIKAFAISSAGVVSLVPPPLRFLLAALPAMISPNMTNARRFVRATSSPKVRFSPQHEDMAQGLELLFRHHRFQAGPKRLSDDELLRIIAPTFILMGSDDLACHPTKTIERARRLIHNVETEIVPDAGHTLTFDRPDLVMSRLLGFFTP